MSLIQLQAPNLNEVSTSGAQLYLLEGLGFSNDGKLLLVRATFGDDADPGQLHSAIWLYDVETNTYIRCLNQDVAPEGASASDVDVSYAVLVGYANDFHIVVSSLIRGVDDGHTLSLVKNSDVTIDLVSTLLGTEVQSNIEQFALSNDARFMAVQTSDSQLAAESYPDVNDVSDIYLIDLLTRNVSRVSAFQDGSGLLQSAHLSNIIINQNTVHVSFSTNDQFVTSDKNGGDVSPKDAYVWSSQFDESGLVGSIQFDLISAKADGVATGFIDDQQAIQTTTSGSFFTSALNGLVYSDFNSSDDVFFKDAQGDLVSLNLSGIDELADGATFLSSTSGGELAVFLSSSPEFVGQVEAKQIFLANRKTGEWKIVSTFQNEVGNNETISGVISPNGSFVAFTTLADNLSLSEPVAFSGSLYLASTEWSINEAPTGAVLILGDPTQGQVLTASNTLADADGLGTIAYQWRSDGNNIIGATASTYTLTQADVGKAISVKASYTDLLGSNESVTSGSTASVANVNDAATGLVTITGIATQGQVLTASNTLADEDSLGSITYQWRSDGNNISSATGSTYTLTQADVGKAITVKASYTDLLGTNESVTSLATAAVLNIDDEATGTLLVDGVVAEGSTLTASLDDVFDLDGATTTQWQWQISDSGSTGWLDIDQATSPDYAVASDQSEVGKYLRVIATTTDALDGVTIFTGDASSPVANVNDASTGLVTITGTPTQGQILSASNTLADLDGLGTITYQWLANGLVISAATASTYTLTQSDVGKAISVQAIYTDLLGTDESVTSAPIDDVQALAQFSDPIESIDAIGLTPDGQYLIIKSNGVSRMVSVDDVLEFTDETTSALELMNTLEPTPLFVSLVGGETEYVLPEPFTGPESLNLDYVLIDTTPNAVVIGSALNDFIALQGGGNKATDGGLGDDVIDGGVGSTFISGGGGINTFFLDGRADGVSWSTITDFKVDFDKATIWGWKPGVSQAVLMQELGGAEGYQGLTLHFENLLPDDAASGETNANWNSITFSGKSASDFGFDSLETLNAQILAGTNPNFLTGQTVDDYGTHGYLFIS
jgi:hypothetical protein